MIIFEITKHTREFVNENSSAWKCVLRKIVFRNMEVFKINWFIRKLNYKIRNVKLHFVNTFWNRSHTPKLSVAN